MGAYYIVTDLDIRARFDLTTLHEELGRAGLIGAVNVYRGVQRGSYSSPVRGCRLPAEAFDHLLRIIEGLSPEARELWDRCSSRRFDLGFQSYDERQYSRWQVKASLMRRLAAVNGDLVITVYQMDEEASSP